MTPPNARLDDGSEPASAKELLRRLDRSALPSARGVEQLHEILCFLRAYPDDDALLDLVERMNLPAAIVN